MDSSSDHEAISNNPTTADVKSALDEDSLDFSSPLHFSDVVLVVEGTRFHVHKSTLSRWSPVFEAMFTSQFLESTAREIPLPGKRADEVQQLLNVIYSDDAKGKITETNFEFLLELAREYQMDKVQQYCAHYMNQDIDKENCLHRYKVAEHFALKDSMEKCNEVARLKFSNALEENADFLALGFESKFNICMARMKDLEDAVMQYSEVGQILVYRYFDKLQVPSTFQCPNKASHSRRISLQDGRSVQKKFDFSCSYCRKRMVRRHKSEMAPVNALDFDELFMNLYDLEMDAHLEKLLS